MRMNNKFFIVPLEKTFNNSFLYFYTYFRIIPNRYFNLKGFKMKKLAICFGLISMSSYAFATINSFQTHPLYFSANAGIFQGKLNTTYFDETDIYKLNISQSVPQSGYTGGFAIGYSKPYHQQYLIGGEISTNWNTDNATFQGGTAITNNTQIQYNIDFTVVPGILLNPTLAAYLKLGFAVASVQDNLTSAAGYSAISTNYNGTQTITGFVAGLGFKKSLTEHISLFTEGNYHDYGSVRFSQFQNFLTTYSHSSHIYSYSMLIGASYYV